MVQQWGRKEASEAVVGVDMCMTCSLGNLWLALEWPTGHLVHDCLEAGQPCLKILIVIL